MVESAEARARRVLEDWRLKQLGLLRPEPIRRLPDGSETAIHGEDPSRCAFTLGPAVAVVALGPFGELDALHRRWPPPGVDVALTHPPIVVQLNQQRFTFSAVDAPWLLGEVWTGAELLLLGHDGESVLIFRGDRKGFRLCASRRLPDVPQCINLDAVAPAPPKGASSKRKPPPIVSPAAMRRTHARILEGPTLNADDLARARVVVSLCFDAVVRSAEAAAATVLERRVIHYVRPVLEALHAIGENLRGNGTELLRRLHRLGLDGLPGSVRNFLPTLRLIARVAPCLFGSMEREDWQLFGYGLGDPLSPLFAALCAQTGTGCGRRQHALAPLRPPPRRSKQALEAWANLRTTRRTTRRAPQQLDLWPTPPGDAPPVDGPTPADDSPAPVPLEVDPPAVATAAQPAAPDVSRIRLLVRGELGEYELAERLLGLLPPPWQAFAEWTRGLVEVEAQPTSVIDVVTIEAAPLELAVPLEPAAPPIKPEAPPDATPIEPAPRVVELVPVDIPDPDPHPDPDPDLDEDDADPPSARFVAGLRLQRPPRSSRSARQAPGLLDAVRKFAATLGPRGPPELDVGELSSSRRRGIG